MKELISFTTKECDETAYVAVGVKRLLESVGKRITYGIRSTKIRGNLINKLHAGLLVGRLLVVTP